MKYNYEKTNYNNIAIDNNNFILCFLSVGKDYSFKTFLEGLQTIEFTQFDYQKLVEIFNQLNFADIWGSLGDTWNNVNDLISFFGAMGSTFQAIFQSIIQIGQMMWGTITFTIEFIGFLFNNLISFVKFVFTYIFIS